MRLVEKSEAARVWPCHCLLVSTRCLVRCQPASKPCGIGGSLWVESRPAASFKKEYSHGVDGTRVSGLL